jgi:hypothetical protein
MQNKPRQPLMRSVIKPRARNFWDRTLLPSVVIVCLLISACTSMEIVELPENKLQANIRAGELIVPGEQVRLVTSDGREHEFLVSSVDQESIHGSKDHIQIDDVVTVKTRRIHAGKTALLAGGVIGLWAVIAILIAPAAILAAASP